MNIINTIFLLLGKIRKAKTILISTLGSFYTYAKDLVFLYQQSSKLSPSFSVGYYKTVLENISKNLESVLIFMFFQIHLATLYMQLLFPLG